MSGDTADRLRAWMYRVATLGRRDRMRRELDDEMRLHRELLARDIESGGVAPSVAAADARHAFGNQLAIRERSDAEWGMPWLDDLVADVRYGARHLRHSPMFTAVAVVAIGVAIGINAGFFTLVDSMMWRPTPIAKPARFVKVLLTYARGGTNLSVAYPEYQALVARGTALEDLVAFAPLPVAIRPNNVDRPVIGAAHLVSGNFFSALGAKMAAGRALSDADDRDGASPAVMLSYPCWVKWFGSGQEVVGRSITLSGSTVTVVGVAAPDFIGPIPLIPDVWIPIRAANALGFTPGRLEDPENRFLALRGHLRAGVSVAQAQASLSTIVAQPKNTSDQRAEFNRVSGVMVKPNESMVPLDGQTAILATPALVVVALVLVIACANLANLLLARALARQREMSLRLAIGASRARLLRQLLTESLLIALLGGALGLALSQLLVTVLSRSFLAAIPASYGTIALAITGSWRVVAYTLLLAVLSVLVFGLAPALQASAPNIGAALKGDDAAFGTTIRRSRLRDGLVAAQVAGCVALLAASATLVKNLRDISAGNSGLNGTNVLVASMGLSAAQRVTPAMAAERTELARQVAAHTGVVATARVLRVPFDAWFPFLRVTPSATDAPLSGIHFNRVTPRYFDVVGQRLVDGRVFNGTDSVAEARVAIVTMAAARRFWPVGSPIGKALRVADIGRSTETVYTIVGVVADAHSSQVWDDDTGGYVYLPATAADFANETMATLVRVKGGPAVVAQDIDAMATRLDPNTPMRVSGLNQQFDFQLTPVRYGAGVTAGVGAFGLALAVLGLYGIVAFGVNQRRRDVAVHIAMGAGRSDVLAVVLRRELRLVVIGLGVGAVLALGVGLLVSGILIGIAPLGAIGLAGIIAALLGVAIIATLIPATRALAISPMQVLRQE